MASADIGDIERSFFSSPSAFSRGLLRELGLADALLELGGVVLALALAAELALDRLHLLVEVVLALGPLHLRLDPALDLLLDLEDRHLALHQAVDRLQPVADVGLLQELLLLLELGAEMPRDGVGELAPAASTSEIAETASSGMLRLSLA